MLVLIFNATNTGSHISVTYTVLDSKLSAQRVLYCILTLYPLFLEISTPINVAYYRRKQYIYLL